MAQANSAVQNHVPVALLGAAGFIVTADARVINPLLHIVAGEFNTDIGSAGLVVTAYTIPYGLFQLVYGPLGDRLGKLRVMTVAMALFAVGTAACGLAPNMLLLNLLRFLTGTVAAAMIPLSLAYIGDTFAYQERQVAIGKFVGLVALGNILSTSMGGIVGDFLNWRWIFVLYGLVSFVTFWFMWQTSRHIPRPPKPEIPLSLLGSLKPYGQLLRSPTTRLIILAVFIEGVFFYGGFAFLGAFLRDEYNLPYVLIGFMLGGFGLGSLIYSRMVKWLVRQYGENGLMFIGGWVTFACYLIIALVKNWVLFIPADILIGLGYYMLHSTLQTKATELAPHARGTAVSLFAFSLFLGQGIGAAALGLVVDGPGYAPTFLIAGIAMAFLGVWLALVGRRITRRPSIPTKAESVAPLRSDE